MTDEISFDGIRYILAAEAGRGSGLTRDYISRLCREGKVTGKQVGKNWYVNKEALQSFLLVKEHEQISRSEELANKLAQEYKSLQKQSKDNAYSQGNFVERISAKTTQAIPYTGTNLPAVGQFASHAANTPSGAVDAALRLAPHASFSLVTSATEFAHKLVALFVAIMLTFGTYSVVDPHYARMVYEAMRGAGQQIAKLPSAISRGDARAWVVHAGAQVAASASDPKLTGSKISAGIMSFAHSFKSFLDDTIYAIMFSGKFASLPNSNASVDDSAFVDVEVVPYKQLSDTTTASAPVKITRTSVSPTTIINQPIVERVVETQRILSVGGISEDVLNKRIEQLDNKLTSQMFALSAGNSTVIAQNYNVTAQTNKINQLFSVTISDSSISNSSISATSLSVSGTATSSFAGGISIGSGCISVGGTCLGSASVSGDDTQVQFNNSGTLGSSANFTFNNNTNTLSVTNASTTLFSSFGPAYFGGSATSSFSSAGALTLVAPLATSSGGTGISSYAVGDMLFVNNSGILSRLPVGNSGQVVKVSGGVPSWQADIQGTGGAGAFATSSDNLLIYPSTVSNVLVLGASATTTTGNIFEVLGNSLFRGDVTAYNAVTAPSFSATSTATSTFTNISASGNASTTNLTVSSLTLNRVPYITTANAFTDSGNLTFNGTTLTAANLTSTGSVSLGNATTTALFSTTASSTNLFSQLATLGTLTLGNALGITSGGSNASSYTQGQLLSYNGTSFVSTSTIGNNQLANSSLTVTAGTGLSGGGSVSLGGSTSLTLNLGNANTWTALQLFSAGASTSNFSNFGTAYFGGSATSSFSSTGALTLATPLTASSGGLGTTTWVTNSIPYFNGTYFTSNNTNLNFNGTTLTAANLTSTGNVSLGNATTTALFSTTASSTNIFSQLATLGTLTLGNALTTANGGTGAITLTGLL
ncbi:MAG: hypothetical protein Q7S75_03340, partial [bacterium]|nr:hypothetical protein [bacterium]